MEQEWFKMEVIICEMGEAECSLQIGIDTRSWFIQLPWEINEETKNVGFFIYFFLEYQQKM